MAEDELTEVERLQLVIQGMTEGMEAYVSGSQALLMQSGKLFLKSTGLVKS